jgi:hypothetical protein
MFLFLLIALSIYGAINSYLLWKIHLAFPRLGAWLLLPAGVLLLMVAGPVLIHVLADRGWLGIARAFAMVTYPWMAIILWVLFLGLAGDLWNLGTRAAALASPGAAKLLIPPRAQLYALGAGVAVLALWGLWEARSVRIERLTFRSARLAPGSPPVRLIQITDLHMSLLASSGRLERALRLIEEARPDLVISTGDLIDAPMPRDGELEARLAAIRPPLGKFAVFGNHEFYAGADVSTRFLEAGGFRVLRGETAAAGPLVLAGVDDPAAKRTGSAPTADESRLLAGAADRPFTVLLKHQPVVAREGVGRFDLQLSGHTHGGQLFPWGLMTRLVYSRPRGLYWLDQGSALYVSRGTGTWGPPMRLLAAPEVTLITIEPEPPAAAGAVR